MVDSVPIETRLATEAVEMACWAFGVAVDRRRLRVGIPSRFEQLEQFCMASRSPVDGGLAFDNNWECSRVERRRTTWTACNER